MNQGANCKTLTLPTNCANELSAVSVKIQFTGKLTYALVMTVDCGEGDAPFVSRVIVAALPVPLLVPVHTTIPAPTALPVIFTR